MGGRRRSRIEIVADILEALDGEVLTPTRLATAANLPYDRLQPILDELIERGLVARRRVESNPRANELVLTERGREVLRELRRLKSVLRDFGLDLL